MRDWEHAACTAEDAAWGVRAMFELLFVDVINRPLSRGMFRCAPRSRAGARQRAGRAGTSVG